MLSVVIRQPLIQLETPDAMRGRVSAVNSLFIGTSNQIGEFESGVTAAWFGTVPSVLIGGVGTHADRADLDQGVSRALRRAHVRAALLGKLGRGLINAQQKAPFTSHRRMSVRGLERTWQRR